MKLKYLHIFKYCLLAILLLANREYARAQFPTAAAYPFSAYQGTYTPLTGGTAVTGILGDDLTQTSIPIGFSFPFAGGSYTTLSACSNGWLSLANSGSAALGNAATAIPGISPMLMVLWDDLNGSPSGSASYLTTGSAPNRVFTFEYKSWKWIFSGTSNNVLSMQVKLYEGGVIEFVYQQGPDAVNPTPSATIGIAGSSTDYQTLSNSSGTPTSSSTVFTTSISTKPATGQVYQWGQVPCTGVPVTSIVGPTEFCANKPFTLSLSGLSLYSGLTFVWEKSTNGTTWTPWTGPVNAFSGEITDMISIPSWYRATIKCANSNLSYTTAPYFVNISEFYYCYCENSSNPPATNENKVNIGKVKLTTYNSNNVVLNNTTLTGAQVNNPNVNKNYSDFRRTIAPIKMYRDSIFTLDLSQYNSGATIANATVIAYLDYDRNGIFDDYERIHMSKTLDYPVPGEFKDTFRVHDTAHIGITGMRIIIKNGTSYPDSCGNYVNGETEDYLADIRYIPCSGNPDAGIAQSPDTTVCPGGYTYIITDSTYEKQRSELSKIWQVSADNIIWNNINNSSSKDSLVRIFTGQPLHYRLKMVCEATNDTSYSNVLKINNKPSYKCYCFSQSIGGKSLDSSDAGGLKMAGFTLNQGGSHLLNPAATQSRQDYTDNPMIDIEVDSSYQLNIYHTMPGNHHGDAKVTLFIDFNNNHQYDIPQDRVYTGFTSTSTFVLTPNVYIPNDAIVGVPTGMRLIVNNNIAPNTASDSACGTYISGETEDYLIMFHRDFPTSVNQVAELRDLSIYPNPSNGKFTISMQPTASVSDVKVTVSSITGQRQYQHLYQHNSAATFTQDINMEGAAPGIYLVEVTAAGQRYTKKLTIR